MDELVRLGRENQIINLPRAMWEKHVQEAGEHSKHTLAFMGPDHHRVRYYVVENLVRYGVDLAPERIARELNLPLAKVVLMLEELEQNLFFLVRNRVGAVRWAYPVTTEPTPHRLTLDSGERLYAA